MCQNNDQDPPRNEADHRARRRSAFDTMGAHDLRKLDKGER